jgi:hypothetical protein
MLLLSFFSFLLAILVFYKGYQWCTCLEYLLLAVVYLFQFNLSFSIFLSMKVLLSFSTFLFEIISSSDDIKKFKVLNYLMTTWKNPCHAIIGIRNDADHYSPGTPTSTAVDRSFNLTPSKHPATTYQLRSKMFFAPCVGFSFSLTDDDDNDNVLQDRLQTCGKCQDWATVAITLLSCHKYLSYSCINLFRWLTMIHFGFFILLKVFDHLYLKSIQQFLVILLTRLIEDGASKEAIEFLTVYIIPMAESAEICLHVAIVLFHMGFVAFDILNLKEERLEDNDVVVKKCFKLRGYYFERVKLVLFLVLACAWHLLVPSVVLEYDLLVYVFTCLVVERILTFIVSRKLQPIKDD